MLGRVRSDSEDISRQVVTKIPEETTKRVLGDLLPAVTHRGVGSPEFSDLHSVCIGFIAAPVAAPHNAGSRVGFSMISV